MIGEAATTEIARNEDAQGMMVPNRKAAREAGNARRQLEAKSGRKVVTRQNYLAEKPRPKLPPPPGDKTLSLAWAAAGARPARHPLDDRRPIESWRLLPSHFFPLDYPQVAVRFMCIEHCPLNIGYFCCGNARSRPARSQTAAGKKGGKPPTDLPQSLHRLFTKPL
jgi:hypothetical protein